jgi:hypothetical protein
MGNGNSGLAIGLALGLLASCFVSTANALDNCSLTPENYSCRKPCYDDQNASCYHRTFGVLLTCVDRGNQRCTGTAKPQSLVSAEKVNTAISCGLVDALKQTEHQGVDLSTAKTITEDLAFTLVSNTGIGGSLALGVPVYAGVTVGPSLSELNKVTNTSQITNSFTISNLKGLEPNCSKNNSNADWLKYVILNPDPGQHLSRLTVGLEFYVSQSKNDSININIFAIKIGPQFTSENDSSQKACFTFDFDKAPDANGKPTSGCQLGSSGGGQNNNNQ